MRHTKRLALVTLASALAACDSSDPRRGSPPPSDPGAPVAVTLTADQQAEVDRLRDLVATTRDLGADALLARRAVPFRDDLGYDPLAAVNLDLVQGSALALDDAELAALGADGFVITDRHRYPHFAYGYQTIYSQDLPVFVTADAILQAVHQSYDAILAALEEAALVPELDALLASLRTRLGTATALDAQARADADLFLAVALSLLRGSVVDGVAGASDAELAELVALAQNGSGGSCTRSPRTRPAYCASSPTRTSSRPPPSSRASRRSRTPARRRSRCSRWTRARSSRRGSSDTSSACGRSPGSCARWRNTRRRERRTIRSTSPSSTAP